MNPPLPPSTAAPPATASASASATRALSAAWRVGIWGLVVSVLLAAYIGYWERRSLRNEIRELAAERTELLASTMRVSMQVLYSLQSLHAATGRIEPLAFALFARDARQRHPELLALKWAPQVSGRRARQLRGRDAARL